MRIAKMIASGVVGGEVQYTDYLFYDTFSGADGTLLENHVPDKGGAWIKVTDGLLLASNRVVSQRTGEYSSVCTTPDLDADILISAKLRYDSNAYRSSSVAIRVLDSSHYIVAKLYSNKAYIQINNGGWSTAFTSPLTIGLVDGTEYTVTVWCSGASIGALINGTPMACSSVVNQSVKKHGVELAVALGGDGNGNLACDNFSVKKYVQSGAPAFFGDSVTAGDGATAENYRWVNLVAAGGRWASFTNAGLSATVLQNTVQNTTATIGGAANNNGRDTFVARVTPDTKSHLFILYGLNDLRLNDVAFSAENFQNDLGEVVDLAIAAGISAQNIVIGSPPYIPAASYALFAPWDGGSTIKHAAYVAAAAAVATAKGTKYVDIYARMAEIGPTCIGADGIHPNNVGHFAIANGFLSVL